MSRKKKWAGEQEHDHICDLVQAELQRRGFKTLDHYNYSTEKASGELDVFAYKEGYSRAILIETKFNHSYKNKKKAINQLHRAEKYCPILQQYKNITKFYVYHENNTYKINKIK